MEQRYAVYSWWQGPDAAVVDLTEADVVRHIYRDDGGDYRLEQRMLSEDGEPDVPVMRDGHELVFDVWFKDSMNSPWYKSRRIAIGKNEGDAETKFLAESFKYCCWNGWHVLPMSEYLILMMHWIG